MPNYDSESLKKAIVTDSGDIEVPAKWVKDHLGSFRFIDVREPHELKGPLGHIEGVESIPLLSFLSQTKSLDKEIPYVIICRSGRRSALAARDLTTAGVKVAASVMGGMLAWNHQVEGLTSIELEEKHANAENLGAAIYKTNGLPEVSAQWVEKNLGRFRLIDVRSASELESNGAVAQAENIPLPDFMSTASDLDRDQPFVIMCHSGGRSARTVQALVGAGFTNVASMEGGITGWKALGLPYI